MFTQEEINILLLNENVSKCSPSKITYNKKFKVIAVKQYLEKGYSPNEIFKKANFTLDVIGENRPMHCIRKWKEIYNKKGEEELMQDHRCPPVRNKKIVFKNKNEEIEYLKTKIEYMDAENDFLAKLRGLKRE